MYINFDIEEKLSKKEQAKVRKNLKAKHKIERGIHAGMAKRGPRLACGTQDTPPIHNQARRPQNNQSSGTIPNRNSGNGLSSCNSSTTTAATTSKKQTQVMLGQTTPRIERFLVNDCESTTETQSGDYDYDDSDYEYDYVSTSEVILIYDVNPYIPSNEIGLGCMRVEPADVADKGSSKMIDLSQFAF